MALKGKTPAEKCGIMIERQDKWKTVIESIERTSSDKKYIESFSLCISSLTYSLFTSI